MAWFLSKVLAEHEIESLEKAIVEEASEGKAASAWEKLETLRKAQEHQREAAWALLRISDQQLFAPEDVADMLMEIAAVHGDEPDLMALMGDCLEAIRDIDNLNAAPPDHPVFQHVVNHFGEGIHAGVGIQAALQLIGHFLNDPLADGQIDPDLIATGADIVPHTRRVGQIFLAVGPEGHFEENLRMFRQRIVRMVGHSAPMGIFVLNPQTSLGRDGCRGKKAGPPSVTAVRNLIGSPRDVNQA